MLSFALSYAARGWRVFPQAGKVPAIAGGGGVKDATTDEAQIREWWRRYPRSNIGIACGFGWWALDVDGCKGARTMRMLSSKYGPIPETVTSRTGGGGWHMLFRLPLGVELRNWTGGQCDAWPHLGVDIRARGVPITAPPSLHASGLRYHWIEGHGPDNLQIAEPPRWLVEIATPAPLPPVAHLRAPIEGEWGPKPRYSELALQRACECVRNAIPGSQDSTLNAEAYMIGQLIGAGLMPPSLARSWLIAAGMQMANGDERRPWRETEILRKIDRAIAAGMRRPREPKQQSA